METKFAQIDIGRRFIFAGMMFTKTALSVAEDGKRLAHVFLPETVVELMQEDQNADSMVLRKIPVFKVDWGK